ncbi:MAG: hypothetical protein LUC85_00990 [Bacteroidales bacterium]|nr:hypothetical protein [Bacteroidales bacterium]
MTTGKIAYSWTELLAALLLVALGCWLPTLTLNVGFYEDDELYMAMVSLHPDAMTPVAPLTFLLGRWWQALFGEGLVQLHWLAYTLRIAAAAVAGIWLWQRSKRLIFAALLFVVAVCAYPRSMFFDWNVTSDLFLVGLLAVLIDWWQRPAGWRIVLMACMLTLAGWCRVPSFAAVVVVLAVLALKLGWKAQFWKAFSLGFGVAILLSIGVLWLAFGSVEGFVGHFGEKYIVSGHNRLERYFHLMWSYYFPMCYKTFILGLLAIFVAWMAGRNGGDKVSLRRSLGVTLLVVAWTFLLVRVVNPYDWVYGYVWAWVGFCVLAAVLAYKKLDPWRRMVTVTSLIFMILPLVGTNVPLARFNVATYLPFLVFGLLGAWRQWFSVALALLGGAMVGYSALYPWCKECKDHSGGAGMATLTTSLPYLEGIKVSPELQEIYDTNYNTLKHYAEDGGVLILGHEKYLYGMALRGMNPPEPWPHRFESDNWEDIEGLVMEFYSVVPRYKYVAISELRSYRMPDVEGIFRAGLEISRFQLIEDTGYNCKIYCRK